MFGFLSRYWVFRILLNCAILFWNMGICFSSILNFQSFIKQNSRDRANCYSDNEIYDILRHIYKCCGLIVYTIYVNTSCRSNRRTIMKLYSTSFMWLYNVKINNGVLSCSFTVLNLYWFIQFMVRWLCKWYGISNVRKAF